MIDNWIPVTERLPDYEVGAIYLVTVHVTSKKGTDQYVVIRSLYTDNLFELDSYDFPGDSYKRPGWYDYDSEAGFYEIEMNDCWCVKKVVAWMPLPKPYMEAKNG